MKAGIFSDVFLCVEFSMPVETSFVDRRRRPADNGLSEDPNPPQSPCSTHQSPFGRAAS